jgi:hypothetical protein
MRPFATALILFVSILSSGCKNETNPILSQGETGDILPLHVGNTWEYAYTNFDATGAGHLAASQTRSVIRDTTISGALWFMVSDGPEIRVLQNRSDGLWWFISGGEAMLYKYPAAPGDSFRAMWNTNYTKVTSVGVSVSSAQGIFSCIEYEYDISPSIVAVGGGHVREFYCPGVGLVKSEYFTSASSSPVRHRAQNIDLTSCNLK